MFDCLATFPLSDHSTYNLSRRKPRVKAVSPLIAFPRRRQISIIKRPSCGDLPLAIKPKSLRYKSNIRGSMMKTDDINGSSGRLDG